MVDLSDYVDREQAWVKHWVLEKYLQVLILKIGGSGKWSRFVYIDAFAGPWGSQRQDLADTSFGRAIGVMKACQAKLSELGKTLHMEAVFFEATKRRAARLIRYARENTSDELGIHAYHADFTTQVEAVAAQIADTDFAFVLIDPTGYKDVASSVFAPLLAKRGVELLINLMWDFINRFWELPQEKEKLDRIFGGDRPRRDAVTDLERAASDIYTRRLKAAAGNGRGRVWAAALPVANPEKDRTHYFLVYVTHSEIGLVAFGDVASDSGHQQAQAKASRSVRKKIEMTGQTDMFGQDVSGVKAERRVDCSSHRKALLKRVPVAGDEIAVSYAVLADLMEECSCFQKDLQAAVRELVQEEIIEVSGVSIAQMQRRTKNAINPANNECLRRLK